MAGTPIKESSRIMLIEQAAKLLFKAGEHLQPMLERLADVAGRLPEGAIDRHDLDDIRHGAAAIGRLLDSLDSLKGAA
jgi:hypothetical protein